MLPIHIACKNKFGLETIEKLLHFYPESVMVADFFGNRPLHYVCNNPNGDEKTVQLLLDTEKIVSNMMTQCYMDKLSAGNHDHCYSPTTAFRNMKGETPLFLAIKSRTQGALDLMKPENMCLVGLDCKEIEHGILAKDSLIQWVVSDTAGRQIQQHIMDCFAGRPIFAYILFHLIVHIVTIMIFFTSTMRVVRTGGVILPIEYITLIACELFLVYIEIIDWVSTKQYFVLDWNWIDCASIIALLSTTGHMIVLRDQETAEPVVELFILAWVLLLVQFVLIIRSMIFPFARFVAGIQKILTSLIPFMVLAMICLVMFTYAFFIQGNRSECDTFGNCYFWTLEGFVFGLEGFYTAGGEMSNGGSVEKVIDIMYGLLAIIIM